ncbi:MAG: dephospho-CoA kinase [Planctomycetes bacterium]|nr:dephospho-CoA kinase [Planctomycetota bacterium]
MSRIPILGLIGGIGSGKSLVAEEFVKQGGFLIAGDALGHEALRQDDIKARIVERWGPDVLDENGRIQRRNLGTIVFGNPEELRALEAIVFPFIGKRIREEIAKAGAAKFIVLDAAVMMEAGWDHNCDRIILVDAPADVRLRRLLEKRGWNEAEIQAREKSQLPVEDKRRRADFVIDNAGPPERLASQVQKILEELGVR